MAALAGAAGTPSEQCEAAKLKAAGKKALCQTKERAKAVFGVLSNLPRCSTKFSDAFDWAEANAGPGMQLSVTVPLPLSVQRRPPGVIEKVTRAQRAR